MKRFSLVLLAAFFSLLLVCSGVHSATVQTDSPGHNGVGQDSQSSSDEASVLSSSVPIDGLWQQFLFFATGSFAVGCHSACTPSPGVNSEYAPSPPWTFTSPSSGVVLTVVDTAFVGDRFEVFDFGNSIGLTSAPNGSDLCGFDPDVCMLNPDVSSGQFFLPAGSHSITIQVVASPFGAGTAYFRVATATDTDTDGDNVPDDADICPNTSIPETVPTKKLGVNRWALVDGDSEFDTASPAGQGPNRAYSTTDTAGCSCEQIVAELGVEEGHLKQGCSGSVMDTWVSYANP